MDNWYPPKQPPNKLDGYIDKLLDETVVGIVERVANLSSFGYINKVAPIQKWAIKWEEPLPAQL